MTTFIDWLPAIILGCALGVFVFTTYWHHDRKCPVCRRTFADEHEMLRHFDRTHLS